MVTIVFEKEGSKTTAGIKGVFPGGPKISSSTSAENAIARLMSRFPEQFGFHLLRGGAGAEQFIEVEGFEGKGQGVHLHVALWNLIQHRLEEFGIGIEFEGGPYTPDPNANFGID